MILAEDDNKSRLLSTQKEIERRIFTVEILLMANGCFASISEDSRSKIGLITLSIKSDSRVQSSTLLPERRGSVFAGMLGEMLAERTGGIAVVSLHLREEMDHDIMKTLINEIDRMLPARTR
jgi:hypothetical protein